MQQQTSSRNIFTHAGDIGDMVFGLAVVKALGGGSLVLTPNHTLADDIHTRQGITAEVFEFIAPLLWAQPYLTDVSHMIGLEFATHDLNRFRLHWRGRYVPIYDAWGWKPPYSLQQMHAAAFGVKDIDETQPWLDAEAVLGPPVVIARSSRYHNDTFPWQMVADKYRKICGFVGLPDEHRAFCAQFGEVPYIAVSDALHMAGVIKNCRLYVSNTSAPHAIAEGLKVNTITEGWINLEQDFNCRFKRPNAQYIFDGKVELPNV